MALARSAALRTLLCVGVAWWCVAPAHAADAAADAKCRADAIKAIQKRYEAVRDLRARFEQTTRGATISGRAPAESRSRGELVVAKPSRMRWSYEEPEPSLVVSDGKTLWIYDPAFKEVQRMPVGEGFLSGAALEFLLGRGEMERDFDVRLVSCAQDAVELELRPRSPTSYEKLTLLANPRSGDVSRTRIDDLLGNVTTVQFSDLKVNLDPPAATFRFVAPEGTKVIEVDAAH